MGSYPPNNYPPVNGLDLEPRTRNMIEALKNQQATWKLEVIWVVVKIMAPFWVPIIIRHLLFRVPKEGP